MSRLVLKDVRKVINDAVIVDRLNLAVDDGEFLVILGPSGCGKSTTLNMIAGLEDPTEGEIHIRGRDVTRLPPKDRKIAMVFQNYALYPHMTVAENLGFGLRMAGTPRADIERQVAEVAQLLGIEALLRRKPKQISGGQRQRVAVGRALVRNPDLFLFDEPLSNLDAKLRGQTRVELKQLHEKLQATTVYVTHDQTEAMTMASRIVIMRHGVIQQIAPPLDIYNRPHNRFVAEFVGSPTMNMIDCRIIHEHSGVYAVGDGFRTRLADETARQLDRAPAGHWVLGVRPEDILLQEAGAAAPATGSATAEIAAVEPLGNITYVTLRLGRQQMTAVVSANHACRVRDMPAFSFDAGKVHLFRTDEAGEALRQTP